MNDLILSSATFGVVISFLGFAIGTALKKRFKLAIFNPLLIAIFLVIAVLKLFHIDFSSYNASAKYLSYLLTPATVCLAVPLYAQLEKLKQNLPAILCALTVGDEPCLCACSLFPVSTLPSGIRHAASKIRYFGDRDGSVGRTGRLLSNYRCCNYSFRHFRKCFR